MDQIAKACGIQGLLIPGSQEQIAMQQEQE